MPKPTHLDIDHLPLILTMKHVSQVLGIALRRAYELTELKDFPCLRIGTSIRVPRDAFFQWIEDQSQFK